MSFSILTTLVMMALLFPSSQGQLLRRRLQGNTCQGCCREPSISSIAGTNFVQRNGGTVDETDNSITLQTNEWATYEVKVPTDGTFLLRTQLTFENNKSSMIVIDPQTAQQHAQITATKANSIMSLRAGTQQLKLFAEEGPIQVSSLQLDFIDSMPNYAEMPSWMRAADQYTSMEGIAVQDDGSISSVSLLDRNNWVQYTFQIPSTGKYRLNLSVSSMDGNSALEVVDGDTGELYAAFNSLTKDDEQKWKTLARIVSMAAGPKNIRVRARQGGVQLASMQLSRLQSWMISPEMFSQAADGVEIAESSEGTPSITSLEQDDWIQYRITVPYRGLYQMNMRVSSSSGQGGFEVLDSDTNQILASVNSLPATGEAWVTIRTEMDLESGPQNLMLRVREGGWQYSWIRFSDNSETMIDGHTDGNLGSGGTGEPLPGTIDGGSGNEEVDSMDSPPDNTHGNGENLGITENANQNGPSSSDTNGGDENNPSTNYPSFNSPPKPSLRNPAVVMVTASSYSSMNGVELGAETRSGLPSTTSLDAGDSITYSVTVPKKGRYEMKMSVSSPTGEGAFEIDDAVTGTRYASVGTLPKTENRNTWKIATAEMHLAGGPQQLRIHVKEGGWSYSWMRLTELPDLDTTKNTGTAVDRGRPATAADPARPTIPSDPARPATPADPARPATPADPARPATPATPARPATPANPARPATPADPARPATPANPARPATPADPARPATPANPARPATPADPAQPATEAQPAAAAPYVDPLLMNCDVAIEAAKYTTMSGIQVQGSTEGMDNIGWLDPGDWVEYSVSIPSAGSYSMGFRVASPEGWGGFDVLNSGAVLASVPTIPKTRGWQDWTTVTRPVSFPSGLANLRINILNGGFNLVWICLTRA